MTKLENRSNMDTREAEQQVKGTVEAYLASDGNAFACIASAMQRPLTLVGKPSVCKMATVSQVAAAASGIVLWRRNKQ